MSKPETRVLAAWCLMLIVLLCALLSCQRDRPPSRDDYIPTRIEELEREKQQQSNRTIVLEETIRQLRFENNDLIRDRSVQQRVIELLRKRLEEASDD